MVSDQAQVIVKGRWSESENTVGGYKMQTQPVYNVKCSSRCKLTVDLQHVKNRHDFESTNSDGKKSNSENKKLHIGVQVYLGAVDV